MCEENARHRTSWPLLYVLFLHLSHLTSPLYDALLAKKPTNPLSLVSDNTSM